MSKRRSRKKPGIIEAFDEIRSDYDMSRESRFVRRRTGLAPQGSTADYHYRVEQHYYDDIEKARDMDRNDSIVGQTVDRSVANIVQEGFTLEPQTSDKSLDNELFFRWKEWSEDPDMCDAQGEFTWQDFERFSCRSMLVDGDILHVGTNEGMLQAWEAHQIRSFTQRENTIFGVTMDDFRRRLFYWLVADPINPNKAKQNEIELPCRDENGARQIFHVYNPKRMTQSRGVTSFAPIFAVAGMRDDIDFAMLVQRQVASCFAIFRKRQYLPEVPHLTPGYGEGTTETSGSGETRYIENIAPGMEVIGQPGEELQGFSPDIPGGGYEFQLKTILQTIGVNLGLPLCLVLMDGSETNFSGWRGAVDEARKGFKMNQRNLIKRMHEPVYRWKVRQWISEDAALRKIAKTFNVFAHKWSAPVWQYIDPVGDAQGDQIRLQNGLISPRRLHQERGRDWEMLVDETLEDMAYAIENAKRRAQAINRTIVDGAPVHWRELISLPMPNGIQMSFQDPAAISQQDAPEANQAETTEITQGVEKVADTALNGAQVTAASQIVEKVAAGILPRESGISQLVFFFQLSPQQAEQVMGTAGTPAFVPSGTSIATQPIETQEASNEPASEEPQAEVEVGTGEFKDISRQQWNRNRKAIKDILTELAAAEISPAMAEVMLSGLGLSKTSIESLIADASDGKIDTPEDEM